MITTTFKDSIMQKQTACTAIMAKPASQEGTYYFDHVVC